jgi:hypothetical protein
MPQPAVLAGGPIYPLLAFAAGDGILVGIEATIEGADL